MKKTFKYLLLALLIIPCTLVFAACGGDMSRKDLKKFLQKQEASFEAAQQYSSYKDMNLTFSEKTTIDDYIEVELYNPNTDIEYSDELITTTETQKDIKFSRVGKGADTSIFIEVVTSTKVTEPIISPEKVLLQGKTVTENKQTETFVFGRMGAENRFAVLHKIVNDDTKISIAGTEQPPVSNAEDNVNEYNFFSAEADFKKTIEDVVEFYVDFIDDAGDGALQVNGSSSNTINAKKGKSTLNVDWESVAGYEKHTFKAYYEGNNLMSVKYTKYHDDADQDNHFEMNVTGNIEFDYAYTGEIELESDLSASTLNAGLSNASIVSALENLIEPDIPAGVTNI